MSSDESVTIVVLGPHGCAREDISLTCMATECEVAQPPVPCKASKSAVGVVLHVSVDLAGMVVCGLRD